MPWGKLAGDANPVDVAGESILADAGFGGARADDVDADVPLRQFDRGHFGEGNLGGFGAGIRGEAEVGEDAVAVDRGDDDDAAAAGCAQVGDGVFDGEEGAAHVDVVRLIPFLGRNVLDGGKDAVDAGVGHDDVEAAPTLNGGGHQSGDVLGISYVAGQSQRLAA